MNVNLDNEFKEIFETISDVSCFLNLTSADDLICSDIEKVFYKSHYIEQFIKQLKIRNLDEGFENKLKDYFTAKGRRTPVELDNWCDEVLTKMMILQPSPALVAVALKQYLSLFPGDRFERLVTRLANLRELFIDVCQQLAGLLDASDLDSALLAACWAKMIDSGPEVTESVVQPTIEKMFLDIKSVHILCRILCLESSASYSNVKNVVLGVITSKTSEPSHLQSWKAILESDYVESVLSAFPQVVDSLFSVLRTIGNTMIYSSVDNTWQSATLSTFNYANFLIILEKISKFELVHYNLKRFVYINKQKGDVKLWEKIDRDLYKDQT